MFKMGEYYGNNDWRDYKALSHYGIKGMKWRKRKSKSSGILTGSTLVTTYNGNNVEKREMYPGKIKKKNFVNTKLTGTYYLGSSNRFKKSDKQKSAMYKDSFYNKSLAGKAIKKKNKVKNLVKRTFKKYRRS